MSKIDVADGYYHFWVRRADIPKLGVILPDLTQLGGTSYCSPHGVAHGMGVFLPLWFCAASETIANLTNNALLKHQPSLPHWLKCGAMTLPAPGSPPLPCQDTFIRVLAPLTTNPLLADLQ
jgi:hypothetical protein